MSLSARYRLTHTTHRASFVSAAQNLFMYISHLSIYSFVFSSRISLVHKVNNEISLAVSTAFLISNSLSISIQQNIVGKDCKLKEPIYGTTFDLTSLHSDLGHRVSGVGEDYVEFNLCGNLTRSCGGSDSVAACFHHNGKEYRIGEQCVAERRYRESRLLY